jgi:uncharacterized iron-regulated membrane protein
MRKVLLNLHTYVGLGVGLLLALTGLTGSLIVFGDGLDAWLNPGLLKVEPRGGQASPQVMLDAARVAYPNERPARVRLPREAHDSAEICFEARRDPRCVYVDPYSTSVLGERVPAHSLKGRLVSFHRGLPSGEVGEIAIGVCGESRRQSGCSEPGAPTRFTTGWVIIRPLIRIEEGNRQGNGRTKTRTLPQHAARAAPAEHG